MKSFTTPTIAHRSLKNPLVVPEKIPEYCRHKATNQAYVRL